MSRDSRARNSCREYAGRYTYVLPSRARRSSPFSCSRVMIVMTVVYASWRVRARSSTTSRTVALPRDQTRSMTCASSEPRNLSSPRRIRFSLPTSPVATTSFCSFPTEFRSGRSFFALGRVGEREVRVREREVQQHHDVPVRRLPLVAGTADEPGALERDQVGVREGLRNVGPDRGAHHAALTDEEGVEDLQARRRRGRRERLGGPRVPAVLQRPEKLRLRAEEVELPFRDGHGSPRSCTTPL